MDDSYSPPNSEVTSSKSKPWGKWIGFGCLGVLAFFLLLGVSCFFMVKGAMKVGSNEFGPICAPYLEKLGAKDFSGAYALLNDEAKQSITEEKHNKLMRGITEKLGPIQSMDVQSVQTGIDQTGRWGRIIYGTKFQNGEGTIRFELRKKSNEYQILGVFFNSPVLNDYLNKALSD